jgi:hypothetical protein
MQVHPGEAGADTEAGTVPERQVRVRSAGDVETVGIPRDLLDRTHDQLGISPDGVALVRVGEQQQGPEVDARHGGFVAGEQQGDGQPGDASSP